MRFDVAVVIITVCRDALLRAVRSIYAQDLRGSIQVLVGVDVDLAGRATALHAELERERPPHVTLTWIDPRYSTSARHGGVHACHFGGSLRTALSFCANSACVAYLDDDDWYDTSHLRLMLASISGKSWAFSLCWYANPDTGAALCEDGLESLGPGRGCYRDRFGGFVRPSALMIDKLAMSGMLHLWSQAAFTHGDGEDRLVFEALRRDSNYGETTVPTVLCSIDPRDDNAALRNAYMRSRDVVVPAIRKLDSLRGATGL